VQCEQRESTTKSNDMDKTIRGSGPTKWLGELAVMGSWRGARESEAAGSAGSIRRRSLSMRCINRDHMPSNILFQFRIVVFRL
jgi:hypothetical protein